MNRGPRTVFMGTPEIAVPALTLLARRTTVQCVVTQPDRPAGRGHHVQPPAVKLAAQDLGLPLWQPETLRDAQAASQLQGAELFVVMAYGELLRQPVLDLPSGGCINLHASLLPRWRGASPLQAAIRAGDAHSGVSVMRMVRALDAGAVCLAERVDLPARATLPWLHDTLAVAAARALERFLDAWPRVEFVPQDESAVTTCRKLTSDDGHLDFARPVAEVDRWIRAYTPAPGCWALAGDLRVRILEAEPRAMAAISGLPPGEVTAIGGDLLVGCADGCLAITRLQLPGRRVMEAAEFLNGHLPPTSLA